jgi:predicted nucleic acid-binding protein
MANRSRSFASVMIVQLPEGFKLQKPWTMPPTFSGGELYATKLTHAGATGFANTFNTRQLADGLPDRRWAIAVMSVQKPGRATMLEAFEQHEKQMSDAIAWWNSLSEHERTAAKKCGCNPDATIFEVYRTVKRLGIAAAFDKHKEEAARSDAVAWWDALSDDERDQALAAAGGKNKSINKAYRIAHGLLPADDANKRQDAEHDPADGVSAVS